MHAVFQYVNIKLEIHNIFTFLINEKRTLKTLFFFFYKFININIHLFFFYFELIYSFFQLHIWWTLSCDIGEVHTLTKRHIRLNKTQIRCKTTKPTITPKSHRWPSGRRRFAGFEKCKKKIKSEKKLTRVRRPMSRN